MGYRVWGGTLTPQITSYQSFNRLLVNDDAVIFPIMTLLV